MNRTADDAESDPVTLAQLAAARAAALELDSAGIRISRRTLRGAGLRGSNADLGVLARIVSNEMAADHGP